MTIINQIINKFIRFLLLSGLTLILLFIVTEIPDFVNISEQPTQVLASAVPIKPDIKPLQLPLLAEFHSTFSGFQGTATAIPQPIIAQMKKTGSWQSNCPISPQDLAYLQLNFWGFDNQTHQGELVVHQSLAQDFLEIFAQLYEIRFPIEKMRLIENYDANDELSMLDNNSSAFNCREITRRPGYFSQHSYGRAVDINPIFNPYLTISTDYLIKQHWDEKEDKLDFIEQLMGYKSDSLVNSFCQTHLSNCIILPKISTIFIDRTQKITGLIQDNSPIIKIFKQKGFIWGGNWRNVLDYQHFEYQESSE